MELRKLWQRALCWLLVLSLWVGNLPFNAMAVEVTEPETVTEETRAVEKTAATEETVLPEETAATEEAAIPEETKALEETMIPEETEAPEETVAAEETEPSAPIPLAAEDPVGVESQPGILWEQGTIANATGLDRDDTTRLRTAGYLNLADYSAVTVETGYTLVRFVYDGDYNYINGTPWLGNGVGFSVDALRAEYPEAVYLRVALRAMDSRVLTPEEISDSGIAFYAPGEQVPGMGGILQYTDLGSIGSWQDGAIWGGKLFVLGGAGSGAVYDPDTLTKLGTLTLGSTDVLKPHANSVSFGNAFYAPGDKYPLLYVNVYNNYASEGDRKEGTCCVYRITESGDSFSGELVQVISIGFTEDLGLWKSKENNGDVRPYGNFAVDAANGKLWAFVMRDAELTTRFFRFDLPAPEAGTYSEIYRCSLVTLEVGDIEAQFDTAYFHYLQGCTLRDGKLLSVEGFHSGGSAAPKLRVVDLTGKTLEVTYDLALSGLTKEPEVVCADPETGKLFYAAADGVLRVLDLPEMPPQGCSHSYQDYACTLCGAADPRLAAFRGKVISIMGDSISTFAGYIPVADGFNLAHKTRYPQDNLLTDVNETWWMQVLNALDAKLGINDSWASSEVYNYIDAEVNSTSDGTKACMASTTRIQNLGSNGKPDVILFFGGTNDITQSRPLGSFDPATAPAEVDLTSVKWDTVADAYVDAIMRMQHYYPDAEILAMLPYDRNSQGAAKVERYNSLFAAICEHYGVPYVDLRDCGISASEIPDGTHPDADGMDHITGAVLDALMKDCSVSPGAHTVHSVTHRLAGAKSSLSYYKGVSHGKPFVTTISGENVSVTVTMGGRDITTECYAEGVVSIESVTGDLVITAEGAQESVFGDYLQELPEMLCPGTNLWTALDPVNLYYRSGGWGVNATGLAHSITFRVSPGDKIWATSFRESGINGGTKNGIALTWFGAETAIETLSPEKTYAEYAQNGFLTAPEGAVAVNVVMWNGEQSNEVYLLDRVHTYESGSCTLCGAADPRLEAFRGKVISIMGASIDTFAGWIPTADGFNLEHRARYPDTSKIPDVTTVEQTWWHQLITALDAKLGINESWAGSGVYWGENMSVQNGDTGEKAAMASLTRIQNLGANGKPDVILFHGGGNDMTKKVTVGTFDPATAPTQVDLTTTQWETFADAYVDAIMRMQYFYPEAKIVAMLQNPSARWSEAHRMKYVDVMEAVCRHYGVTCVYLEDSGITLDNLPDGVHPDDAGMDCLTDATLEVMCRELDMVPGEHTVYSVTHQLTNGSASKHYYKGVSAGASFEETLTGDSVTVTMGGVDITEKVYSDGILSIPSVTGDLVITAKGIFNADGHLQALPENVCSGTNLWTALTPENIYYTVDGWGLFSSSPNVHSITFPVTPGEKIWATSFQKAGVNGGSANATRITWFDENGLLATVDRNTVYAEFLEKGYITVPEGAAALNVPMSGGEDTYEVYLPDRAHEYENGICLGCGEPWDGPVILQQPSNGQAKLGETYCVTVEAQGEGLSYTWYGRDAGAADWFKSSVTDNTYDDVMTAQRANREVYCVITDAQGRSVTTNTVKLILLPDKIWQQWTQPVTMAAGTYPTYGGSSTGYYSQGQTFGGILYSSTFREGSDVLWNLNPSTYYSAAANPASLLYTLDYRGRVFNESAWAGSVCSTTALRACGYPFPYSTEEIQALFREKTDHSINALEFSDILWTQGHVAGIIGVEPGTSVTVIEQAGQVRVFTVTAAEWDSYFAAHWTHIYRGDPDETQTEPEFYPENLSIIFERGNNTYVTDTARMLFYIPTASTVYLTKDGSTQRHSKTSFPTRTVNGTVVYDLASLFDGVGDYFFHTEENTTPICIKVIDQGKITVSGTKAILAGYAGCEPRAYRVIRLLDADTSSAYNFFEAPEGYTSDFVPLSFRDISGDTFQIENIPGDAAGWKLEIFYDTGYGWARIFSNNIFGQAPEHTHSYENGICTGCGEKQPSLKKFEGKVISILSASTSTFAGWIPTADGFNLEHRARYPQDNLFSDVESTWWHQLITELDAKLGINDSWAGSQVLNTRDTNSGDLGPDAAMASLTRIQNLGANGTPDLILFFGAGNDMGRGVELGSFDPATAPTEPDLTAYKWESLAQAYTEAILRLRYFYPNARIVAMTTYAMPSYVTNAKLDKYGPVLKSICDHYGVEQVSLRDCGVTFDMLPDNIHPNAQGMDLITQAVLDYLLENDAMEAGENVVYPVTHDLISARASKHYYKGISAGAAFEETVEADTVAVTMGGVDITAQVYRDGVISIPNVTGELVITAEGVFDADGHLQALPEQLCPGVNLWKALTPEKIYYTASGWGNSAGGNSWSITFPVQPGDRVWATSLGAYPENGSGANGIRVTWFMEDGRVSSLARETVYAEFQKNGCITAPEGAVALNMPMTNNEERYAVYLLSSDHSWIDGNAVIKECTLCGHVEGGYRIEAPEDAVWIDGVQQKVYRNDSGAFLQLEHTDAKVMTVYSYNDAVSNDPHAQYPTGMQVWRLRFENGAYTVEAMPEWEDLLQYAGASIRVTGVKGIRMITGIQKALRSTLMEGTSGYRLLEYGTAVSWGKDLNGGAPVLGQGYTMSNFAYKRGTADPIFADTGDIIQFTNVLVGFTDDQLGSDLVMRPYIILEDPAGQQITVYGGCVTRSIGYIAKQNQDTFPEESKADAYIEDIISKVYG